MADIYLVKEKKGCGMFGVDCIVIFLAVSWFIPNIILSIIATLVGASILYALMQIPVFGRIVVAICGLVVAFGVYSAVESLTGGFGKGKMSRMFTENPGMWWLLVIVGTLIFVGLHFVTCPKPASKSKAEIDREEMYYDVPQPQQITFSGNTNEDHKIFVVDDLRDVDVSLEDMTPYEPYEPPAHSFQDAVDMFNASQARYMAITEEMSGFNIENLPQEFVEIYQKTAKQYNAMENRLKAYIELFNDSNSSRREEMAADIETKANAVDVEIARLESAFRLLKQTQSASGGSSFFQGCKTIDELNKRYRNLTKTFHPDIEAGDEETMKLINAEYERLKCEFTSES